MYYNGVKSKIWEGQFTFQSIKKFRQGTLLDWVNNLDEFSYDIEAPTSYFWVSLENTRRNLLTFLLLTLTVLARIIPLDWNTTYWHRFLDSFPRVSYKRQARILCCHFKKKKKTELIHEGFISNRNEIESKTLQDALWILCKGIFSVCNCFNGSLFNQDTQTNSVPLQILSLIRR